jgi:hypothetical protein
MSKLPRMAIDSMKPGDRTRVKSKVPVALAAEKDGSDVKLANVTDPLPPCVGFAVHESNGAPVYS